MTSHNTTVANLMTFTCVPVKLSSKQMTFVMLCLEILMKIWVVWFVHDSQTDIIHLKIKERIGKEKQKKGIFIIRFGNTAK